MYKVTDIEYISKRKVQVSINGEPAFILTVSQFRELNLLEDDLLDEASYLELIRKVGRFASKAAMDLLLKKDYSKNSLKNKLIEKGFSSEIAEIAVDYVESYHYIDDERFAAHLIDIYQSKYSRQMLVMKMKQKGLSEQVIRDAMDQFYKGDMDAIRRELSKSLKNISSVSELDDVDWMKRIQSLQRKGYRYSDIRNAIKELE